MRRRIDRCRLRYVPVAIFSFFISMAAVDPMNDREAILVCSTVLALVIVVALFVIGPVRRSIEADDRKERTFLRKEWYDVRRE